MKIILQLLCLLHPVTGSRFTLTSHKLFWLDIFINIRNFDFVEFELDRLVTGQDEAEAPLLTTRWLDRHDCLHLDLVLSLGSEPAMLFMSRRNLTSHLRGGKLDILCKSIYNQI